ncbi:MULTISPECIES: MarR family transcriptional regulator [unclassified Streptomyces]|uniref:MarR family winged helix-turn-helix transcriptional regulator n=1 Tax=unclassified Streptomyces TaxID=2593676 RepID=UPI002DDBA41C|nr:MarR family transcriptional regulator [Streptomyces sp. NBC_00243]WRZ24658.1 MarR family transcriptional regulator [Streptomyces sp. NBC_00243]
MADAPEGMIRRPALVATAPVSFGLFALARALHGYGAELLSDIGLHPGQELILMQLFDRNGQTQAELQQAVGLDHSTVSRSIRRMVDAGLLTREPSASDRRAMIVSLSENGEAMRKPITAVWTTLERLAVEAIQKTGQEGFMTTAAELEHAYTAARRT